jgi:hypothetical protein
LIVWDLDMFRNGRLVLVQPAEDTDLEEIKSVNSLTQAEIDNIVLQTKGNAKVIKGFVERVQSLVALDRIEEALVEEELTQAVEVVKERRRALNPDAPVEREVIVGGTQVTVPPRAETPSGG